MRVLAAYRWPGNLRELRNASKCMVLLQRRQSTARDCLTISARVQLVAGVLRRLRSLEDLEREAIAQTLEALATHISKSR